MRVLYLSKNVNSYKSANYQKEFLNSLSLITSIYLISIAFEISDIINLLKLSGLFELRCIEINFLGNLLMSTCSILVIF